MEYLFLIPLCIYLLLVVWFIRGWLNLKETIFNETKFKVSIIIPCRNESTNIIRLLEAIDSQKTEFLNLEVIIIDDHSSDDTLIICKAFKGRNFNPIILQLEHNEQGKKSAISAAISLSKGEIIVCTDADCVFGNQWLTYMLSPFNNPKITMAIGPVMFFDNGGFWNQLMQMEFLSLIAIGASSVQNGYPNMCNGANIAYRKLAFYEVNGFKGNEHIASGDDEFLMHKINHKFPQSIQFVKHNEAIVNTEAPKSFSQFIHQRIRWGSKAAHYQNFTSILLPAFMFGFNLLLFLTPILFFLGLSWPIIAILWLIKLSIEIVFFSVILPFFRSSKVLDLVIPAQIFHVVYITLIGLLSLAVPYSWKGRKK